MILMNKISNLGSSISIKLLAVLLTGLLLTVSGCSEQSADDTASKAPAPTSVTSEEPADLATEPVAEDPAMDSETRPAILVTGITGRQGGALADELLIRGFQVRGLTRDASQPRAMSIAEFGIELAEGDFAEPDKLEAAMQGMHGVFLNTPNVPEQVSYAQNVIGAAKAAGIEYIVYSSNSSAHPNYVRPGMPKAEVERLVRESGIAYTILRPVTFIENYAGMQDQIAAGVRDPRKPDTKQQFISVRDIAFLAAEAFENPDEWNGREENIASDELTNPELVELFSRMMGVPVEFEKISWEEWAETRPASMIELYKWYEEGDFNVDIAALREQYPNLMTFERYLRESGWEDQGD